MNIRNRQKGRNMKNKVVFNSIYAFDFDNNIWCYDSKYCLKDGWWVWDITSNKGEKAFPCDKYHVRELKNIVSNNADLFAGINAEDIIS